MFMTIYGCGLRRSEVTKIRYQDIDSDRMTIKIIGSKNNKDRQVVLPKHLLEQLRIYWKSSKKNKNEVLFPAHEDGTKYNPNSLNYIFAKILDRAHLTKYITIHGLRHSWATHMLEDGINLRYLQILLGHSQITSTAIYTHLVDFKKANIKNPLDQISKEVRLGGIK